MRTAQEIAGAIEQNADTRREQESEGYTFDIWRIAEEAAQMALGDVTPDLIREASNVLCSADNGGWNGRPSEIKRVLRKLVDALEDQA